MSAHLLTVLQGQTAHLGSGAARPRQGPADVAEGELAELAKKPSYVVLNAIPPRSGIGREAAEGLTRHGARVAPAMLSQRAAFAHGVIDGRTAQEFERKAAEEVEALYTWLCGTVGMSTRGQARKAA